MKSVEFTFDFEQSIGPWLGKTSKMIDYYLHEAFAKAQLDLSKEQMIVLKKLHYNDGLNQNELALLTFRDKSSLARLLVKMEKKGYLKRKQSSEDKRINEVYITPVGREVLKKTRPIIQQLLQQMETDVNSSEIQQVIQILKKVQLNLTAKIASL